jgi:endonuclease/exonuclease/phosphatase family metal-dependent hydrolase
LRPVVLVRSWNLFHGNADPPRRRGYLREMLALAVADRPDVLCLQELPVWALRRLDEWTGSQAFAAVARRPLWPGPLSAWVTRAHQGLFRSALTGQANAILVGTRNAAEDLGQQRISDRGRERRVVHAVRVDGRLVVANLHVSREREGREVVLAEIERAREFAEELAAPGGPVVLAGDFNLREVVLPGYSPPGPGIDHVLVKGASASEVLVWPRERRLHEGAVLSDHPPVEVVVG